MRLPDLCTYPESVLLETGVHGEEEGVGVQASVVLVDQHRVHRHITAGGVPVCVCLCVFENMV